MLILNSPLMLQSISAFGTYSDALGEKIRGNYQTFGTDISGEDLLHMTMQEPDIYVGIENNGPFLMDAHIHADNQIKLELVNQLVNRLMLYASNEFTYQDEVFTATLLQKLGITDVKEFMQQIRLHMEKNELTVSLLNRYFEDGRTVSLAVDEFLESNLYDKHELEIIKNEYNKGTYLHNQVFERLMTAECNNAVYTYQNPIQTKKSVSKWYHDMEWMVQADKIHLSQFRENMYYQENPVVFQEYSVYEAKPLAANELTQHKVTARMGAAILENIVNKLNYTTQYTNYGVKIWKNYGSLFYRSAENVLARFRYFQNNNNLSITNNALYENYMNGLIRDELRLVQLVSLADRYADGMGEADTPYEIIRRNIVISILENQSLQKQLEQQLENNIRVIQRKHGNFEQEMQDVHKYQYYAEEDELYREEQKHFEAVYRLLRGKRSDIYLSDTSEKYHLMSEEDFSEEKQFQNIKNSVFDKDMLMHEHIITESVIQEAIDIKLHDIETTIEATIETAAKQQPAVIKSGNSIYEIIRTFAASEMASDVPLMENIGLLKQINSHNVYMKQLLDSSAEEKENLKRIVVDRQQARAAALKALDSPEQALLEIYEKGKAIETEIPKEIERILSITDENTRSFYERLMGFDGAHNTGTAGHENNNEHGETTVLVNDSQKEVIENALHSLKEIYETGRIDREKLAGIIHNQYLQQTHETGRIDREKLSEIIRQINSGSSEMAEYSYEEHLENDAEDISASAQWRKQAHEKEASVILKHSIPKEALDNIINLVKQIYENNTRVYSELPAETAGEIELFFNTYNKSEQNYLTAQQPQSAEEELKHRAVQDIVSEISENSRRPEFERLQELYGHDLNNEKIIIKKAQQTINENVEERELFRQFRDKVYSLLIDIAANEHEYMTYIHSVSNQVRETVHMEENNIHQELLRHRSADIDIQEMTTLENMRTASLNNITEEQIVEHGVQLVHKTKEQMNQEIVDEVLISLEESGILKTNVNEKKEETLVTQKELLDIRNEIIKQSEEHIANMVERSMKTQVHSISDMVYLELERRLKNEQRRRGY